MDSVFGLFGVFKMSFVLGTRFRIFFLQPRVVCRGEAFLFGTTVLGVTTRVLECTDLIESFMVVASLGLICVR